MKLTQGLFFLFSAILFASGCATMGSVQRANTLGEGGIQVGIEPGVKVAASSAGAGFAPDMTVSVRGGITDRLDLGGRIGSNIYDFHMKYMFSDPEGTGPVLSIAPAMSFYAIGTGDGAAMAGHLNLPLLVGLPIGEHQLVFGPRLITIFAGGGGGGGSAGAAIVMAGSSFSFAAQAGDRFGIIPELTLAYPIVAGAAGGGESAAGSVFGDGLLVEFKLGFLIGSQ